MNTRSIAIDWYNNLSHTDKGLLMEGEFKYRHPQSLTGREIEALWYNEASKIEEDIFAPNEGRKGTQRSPFGIGS